MALPRLDRHSGVPYTPTMTSPAGAVAPVRRGEHACCRFAEAADRDRVALAFIGDGLQRGDKVIYLSERDIGELLTRLEQLDTRFESAIASGQFEARSARDAYLADGRFDPSRMLAMLRDEYQCAVAEGYAGLSVTGEMPAAVCHADGGDQLPTYEAWIDDDHRKRLRLDSRSYSILCQYDQGRFGPGVVEGVLEAHPVDASPELAAIGRDGKLAAARDRRRNALRLSGQLDFACAQSVSDVLEAHFDDPLLLDLADLSYVDVAGMRALRGRRRQQLKIAPASDAVRRLLAMLAWDTDPAVELLEAE